MKRYFKKNTLIRNNILSGLLLFFHLPGQFGEHSEAVNGKTPWNNTNFFHPDSLFRFVVVSDRTGGMRTGVFSGAIDKIRLLQPDFVISVGDLIDGYTEDDDLIASQWSEFEITIAKLKMPFFKIAGNHDVSNKKMSLEWKKRFGRLYYYFIYKDVLFLCLSTEDPPSKGISEAQISYFKKVIEKHKNVRWTFVFLHQPLWQYREKAGFDKIERFLLNRRFTVFSGHHHNYLHGERKGNNYLTLATTGGVSPMRGAIFGEFDQIALVTVGNKEPAIVNIDVNGLYDINLVTEETGEMIKPLREGSWFSISPYVHKTNRFNSFRTTIKLSNKASKAMRVYGNLPSVQELKFVPSKVNLIISEKSEKIIPLFVQALHPSKFSHLRPIFLQLNAEYAIDSGSRIFLPTQKKLQVDWIHPFMNLERSIVVDGDLSEWDKPFLEDVRFPGYIKEEWSWHGPEDGYFQFSLGVYEEYLFLAIFAGDDKLQPGKDSLKLRQDKIIIVIDPSYSEKETSGYENTGIITIEIAPDPYSSTPLFKISGIVADMPNMASAVVDSGMTAEIAIPISVFKRETETTPGSFRLNIGFMDQDNFTNTKPSVLWWRPLWGKRGDYPNSGLFVFQK